jgi:hypothetical protein
VKGLPDLGLALPGQPFADVHAVDGEAGQDVGSAGLAVFVAYEFA